MKVHPYKKYEGTIVWQTVNSALDDLVNNGDINELTKREYIMGYIIQALDKRSCIKNESKK